MVHFTTEKMFKVAPKQNILNYREELYGKFNRQIGLLLESKRPRKDVSRKGRLNTRLLYKVPFSETVFTKYQHIPSSSTTVIMLIDGSGSMNYTAAKDINGRNIDRVEACSAIASAFAKSLKTVLNDEVKFEVFVKSAPNYKGNSLGMEGGFVTLTRVLSNSKPNSDIDRILGLNTHCPLSNSQGSYTAEGATFPAIMEWAKKNVTTKNICIFNLTDGDTYATVNNYCFKNEDTALLRKKHFRGVPNMTLVIGDDISSKKATEIYGQDVIMDNDGDFISPMFKTLIKIIDSAME